MVVQVLNERIMETQIFKYGRDLLDTDKNNQGAGLLSELPGKSGSATAPGIACLPPLTSSLKWSTRMTVLAIFTTHLVVIIIIINPWKIRKVIWDCCIDTYLLDGFLWSCSIWGIVFTALQEFYNFILTAVLWVHYFYYLYFTHLDNEAETLAHSLLLLNDVLG